MKSEMTSQQAFDYLAIELLRTTNTHLERLSLWNRIQNAARNLSFKTKTSSDEMLRLTFPSREQKMVALPTVHMNGTSKAELVKQIRDAHVALQIAKNVMCNAAPHGRDYYPQGNDVYSSARAQHYSRLERIEAIMKEYGQIYEGIES